MKITNEERLAGALMPETLELAVRTFKDSGMVILENVFDLDFIADVRAAYDIELAAYISAVGGLEALKDKTFGTNHIGFFPRMYAPIADERVAANAIAVQVSTVILGNDFQCCFYHTNTAMPGSNFQAIHRDSGSLFEMEMHVPHPTTSLVVNIPLCDFTIENGSTEYWPGTHLIVSDKPQYEKDLDARAATMPSVRANMSAGSLALRDLRGWHRGMPNNADYSRTMMALVYQRSWLSYNAVTIPQTTWDNWSAAARNVFRRNTVVEDSEHTPQSWDRISKAR
ncbi:hypothetical protein LBMAG21_03330 [Armatimonadota bacterium]|nr:hypothetical protein LBMAG21_03330 [Armatimonadota bacterium]